MLIDPDYKVYIVKLPGTVKGAIRIAPDGFVSIYINQALTRREQRAVFRHELHHLYHDDMYSNRTIREIEPW